MSNRIVLITENALRNGIGAAYKARSDVSRYGLVDTGIRIMNSFEDPDINTWNMYTARIDELREAFPETEALMEMNKYVAAKMDNEGKWQVLSQDKNLSAVKNKISEGFIISIMEKDDTESWKECLKKPEQHTEHIRMATTPTLQGYTITEYKGIVCGEVILGLNFLRDIAASFTDIFGGRSAAYEEPLANARDEALREMCGKAGALGANAVVGVDIDYESLGTNNGMLMVSTTGTAVVAEREGEEGEDSCCARTQDMV